MKRLTRCERWAVLGLVLLAWGLRWVALLAVPPGWRDDALINVHSLSGDVLREGPTLYHAGASGHEPLYHGLHALIIGVAGGNAATAIWLTAVCGTLTALLTWAVGRRLFNPLVGLLGGALTAFSFWSLMYSRFGLRHIATPVSLLIALYWGWRLLHDEEARFGAAMGVALASAAGIMTYYAGRLTPALLLAMLPLASPRRGRWRPYLLALVAGLLLAAPMLWAAANTAGGDARMSELAAPLNALLSGDLGPFVEHALTTLGMFHISGDPEWLYNIAGRPVFNLVGALIFLAGILTRLSHLDQANARVLLLWLAAGLAPTFLSIPPSSLGHSIVALPAVYLLLTMPVKAAARRWPRVALPLAALLIVVVAPRDLYDYFVRWPQASMVRFLYRADYRALGDHLEAQPEIGDAVAGSFLYGVWDRVAFENDLQREGLRVRWVNPERALVGRPEAALPLYLSAELHVHPQFQPLFAAAPAIAAPEGMRGLQLALPEPPAEGLQHTAAGERLAASSFAGALALHAAHWQSLPEPGGTGHIAFWWEVRAPLPLPPEELIANPPPPGVYNGPRLKVFAHLRAEDGTIIAGDDGLWMDPYRAQVGDWLWQWHQFALPPDAPPGPYTLSVGLYDPATGERWLLDDGSDALVLPVR